LSTRNLWILVGLAILVMVGGVLAWREWASAPAASQSTAQAATSENLPMEVTPEDKVLGAANAPVTIIEYASLTCPHCAHFHTQTLPKLKTDWIDTGKARLVYRDFPLDGAALGAAVIAHCAPPDRYFPVLSLLFERQNEWAVEGEWRERLTQLAGIAGMDRAAVDACLADEARKNAVVQRAEAGQATYAIESTPTFIVNGRKMSGALPIEDFEKIFQEVQPKS
jgi:protein-disulfide isomerase